MSEIRCDKCGALLKAGDIKKEKCWKCEEVVIQKVEQETQPVEDITSEPVAQEDEKKKQTDENKTPDPVVTQSNSQSKSTKLISTFFGISVTIYIINIILDFFRYGIDVLDIGRLYPINIITMMNPILYPIQVLNEISGLNLFVANHNTFFNFFEYLEYYGWGWVIMSIILCGCGPVLNYFVAKKIIGRKAFETEPIPTVLKTGEIIKNSFSLGLNNKGLIIGASILWALTAWVPYLNVGTTIGFLGIIISISKGNSTTATEIFNAKYRKKMGEFFLLLSFMIIGIASGYAFVIIPGIVISIAWSQSILLLIDKGYSPLESIKTSNEITYGEKLTIFIGYLSLVLIFGLSIGLLITLAVNVDEILALLIGLTGYIAFILVMIGCSAYIYGELNKKLTAENN